MLASRDMRPFLFLSSLTLILALVTGCRGPAPANDGGGGGASAAANGAEADAVRLEVPADPEVGPAVLRVYVLDQGDGVEGAEVEITGTMTHAGMEPVIRDAPPSEPGLYVAEDFEFTMAGDWVVTADVTLPDGREVADETTVTVRSP